MVSSQIFTIALVHNSGKYQKQNQLKEKAYSLYNCQVQRPTSQFLAEGNLGNMEVFKMHLVKEF